MSDKVYGIDLGTTYSAIAKIDEFGMPKEIKNMDGDDATPSVVYFEGDNNVIVGKEAKASLVAEPEHGVKLIKREIGNRYPLEFQGKEYTPESISGIILRSLVEAANAKEGTDVNQVVITVPAYFGTQEREATKQAGQMAGLEVVGIVTEPVAAALSVAQNSDKPETFLVYDLGGGTFDTTVMKVDQHRTDGPKVEVLAIDGNRLLGGADWDDRLANVVAGKIQNQLGIDENPLDDPEFRVELLQMVEDKKKSLTDRENVKIGPLYYDGQRVTVELSRDEFNEATADLVAQTIEIAKRTVATAEQNAPGLSIDRVLMVGGSSRMRMIPKALQDAGWDPQPTDYDLAVAKGAALFGQNAIEEEATWEHEQRQELGDEVFEQKLEDVGGDVSELKRQLPGAVGGSSGSMVANVLSRALGIAFVDGIEFFFHTNDKLPAGPEIVGATTVENNQISAEVTLYEQAGEIESSEIADNKLLATVEMPIPAGKPAGYDIDLVLSVSDEGLCVVVVSDPQTGEERRLEAAVS